MSGSVEKRFYRKLSEPRPNGCIEWLGWKNNTGYGLLKSSSKPYRHLLAHRVAYEIHYGPIPAEKVVMHSCDNKACVNWKHLSVGTHQDNTQDMLAKDRQRKSKVDFAAILEMRANGLTQEEIAKNLGISRPLVSLLLSGKVKPNHTGN